MHRKLDLVSFAVKEIRLSSSQTNTCLTHYMCWRTKLALVISRHLNIKSVEWKDATKTPARTSTGDICCRDHGPKKLVRGAVFYVRMHLHCQWTIEKRWWVYRSSGWFEGVLQFTRQLQNRGIWSIRWKFKCGRIVRLWTWYGTAGLLSTASSSSCRSRAIWSENHQPA